MDNYPIETQARTDSRRSLHVMNKTSHSHELPDDHSGTRYRVLFGVVVIADLLRLARMPAAAAWMSSWSGRAIASHALHAISWQCSMI